MTNESGWSVAPGLHLQSAVLDEIVRLCVRNSEYSLTAGGYGTTFVDLDELFSGSTGSKSAATSLLDEAAKQIKALADSEEYTALAYLQASHGPVGAIAARTELAEKTDLVSLEVRPHRRVLSQAIKPFHSWAQHRVLIVADVATSGASIGEAARLLWRAEARNVGALALFDRQEGATEYLAKIGVDLHYVLRLPVSQAEAS